MKCGFPDGDFDFRKAPIRVIAKVDFQAFRSKRNAGLQPTTSARASWGDPTKVRNTVLKPAFHAGQNGQKATSAGPSWGGR
jgi:hypothetical protein